MSTRWGSIADMVSRILEQQEAGRLVLGQDRKTSHLAGFRCNGGHIQSY